MVYDKQQTVGCRLEALGNSNGNGNGNGHSKRRAAGQGPGGPTLQAAAIAYSLQPKACRPGFSLMELMIVLVIIGLLAGAVTLYATGYLNKAKQNTARREIATIMQAVESFYAVNGRYPTNDEGLDILSKPSEKFPDPLLRGEPTDPWGNDYQYNSPGTKGPFEIICYGGDGREGGDGWDTDISSDKLKE